MKVNDAGAQKREAEYSFMIKADKESPLFFFSPTHSKFQKFKIDQILLILHFFN